MKKPQHEDKTSWKVIVEPFMFLLMLTVIASIAIYIALHSDIPYDKLQSSLDHIQQGNISQAEHQTDLAQKANAGDVQAHFQLWGSGPILAPGFVQHR